MIHKKSAKDNYEKLIVKNIVTGRSSVPKQLCTLKEEIFARRKFCGFRGFYLKP